LLEDLSFGKNSPAQARQMTVCKLQANGPFDPSQRLYFVERTQGEGHVLGSSRLPTLRLTRRGLQQMSE